MKVEIIDITDCSGSMGHLRNDVIGGFNTLLADQKAVPGEARLTHIQFDHEYMRKFVGKDIHDVEALTLETYMPRGSTALLDAIGRTLNEQGQRIASEKWADKVIVCIRTDGQENASREFTAHRIKTMIEHAQAHDWVFIFSAANQDAFATGAQMGINNVHTQSFAATGQGLAGSYAQTSNTLRSLRAAPDAQAPDLINAVKPQAKI